MNWPTAPLGELCEMDRQGVRPDASEASLLPFLGVENVEAGSGAINLNTGKRVGSQKSTSFRFDERHVLYGKLRPYLNKVATPEFAGRCSTELVPLRPRVGVDREYLGHLLRRKQTVDHAMLSVTGARMPRTDMKALFLLPVPIPPLEEQRRIVGILNRAAKIERLKKRAQERLREFIPALFVKMFGDPAENPMGWEMRVLGNLCEMDRNTLKPSDPGASELRFVGVENVDSGTGAFNFETHSRVGEQKSTAFLFD
ncbi:MAG: restriction endonuclease subunit S, partial [Gammaproteobacteria bacterium]|nr:restriction endonuclease subunit S [Gammaproteobacteria bacterium]